MDLPQREWTLSAVCLPYTCKKGGEEEEKKGDLIHQAMN